MGIVDDWVAEHVRAVIGQHVDVGPITGTVGTDACFVVTGRHPTDGRPNQRMQPVMVLVEHEVTTHVEQADGAELERTGKLFQKLLARALALGEYDPTGLQVEKFTVRIGSEAVDR